MKKTRLQIEIEYELLLKRTATFIKVAQEFLKKYEMNGVITYKEMERLDKATKEALNSIPKKEGQ